MNDSTFRATLKKTLLAPHIEQVDTAVLEELSLRQGQTRVDMAVVNGILHGFEIKSDTDCLSRLPQQALTYGLVLDQATLVVAERHLKGALDIVPDWWGIEVASYDCDGKLGFETLQSAEDNPRVDALCVAELLWREEALELLEEMNCAKGYRSKSRSVLHQRLVEVTELDVIRARVRHQLKVRKGWKVVS